MMFIMEWAISHEKSSSRHDNWLYCTCIVDDFFLFSAPRKPIFRVNRQNEGRRYLGSSILGERAVDSI